MENQIIINEKGASTEIKSEGFPLTIEGVSQWLESKNILKQSDTLLKYADFESWARSGGETYRCSFAIQYIREGQTENKIINIKAIVLIPVEKTLVDWKRRRDVLIKNRVPVSNWYWSGKGIIIEDFYPLEYTATKNFVDLVQIAYILDKLGFSCLKFLDDIRCDLEGKPYYIDFGFDLGEPNYFKKTKNTEYLIQQFKDKESEIRKYIKDKYRQ